MGLWGSLAPYQQHEYETCATITCWKPSSPVCFPFAWHPLHCLDAHESFYKQEYHWTPRIFWRMHHFHLPTNNKTKPRISPSCFTERTCWLLGNAIAFCHWSLKRKGWKTHDSVSLQRTFLITVFSHCWLVRLTSQRNVSKREKGWDVKSPLSLPTSLST